MSDTSSYTLLPWDALVAIPETAAVCPWCQATLLVDVEEWQDDASGTRATDISWSCRTVCFRRARVNLDFPWPTVILRHQPR